jgi:predicted nucleotidyltransferase
LTPEIDLTVAQRDALLAVLSPYADRIETVGVYGSRAQGTARPGSDVDLVVYGRLSRREIAEIIHDLDESDLSIFADVIAYEGVSHAPLKAQIDKWMRPLFMQSELTAG